MKTLAMAAAFALAIAAQTATGQTFSYTDFSSVAGLTLNGSAAQSGNVLRLTANASNQTAGAWRSTVAPVAAGFDTTFSFRSTPPAVATKAEGMAFVIHNLAETTLGGSVWGIGYGPGANGASIANSLAIELDTFQDGFLGDSSSNELTVHTRGTLANDENESFSIGRVTPAVNLSNGAIHTIRIRYVPGTLEVFADNLTTPVLTVAYSMATGGTFIGGGAVGGLNLPNGTARMGFSATTGAGTLTELVEILSWSFTSTPLVHPSYAGTVQAGAGGPLDVLTIDGSPGDFYRTVKVATFQPFTIALAQPPLTAAPAAFAILGTFGHPDGSAAVAYPPFGTFAFNAVVPLPPDVFLLADSFSTGVPALLAATPAPWSFTDTNGLSFPFTVTLQGLIADSTSPVQASVTNALTLEVFQAPPPTIASVLPNSAPAGSPITITGTNFRPGATLAINGTAVAYTTFSPTQIVFPYQAGTPCGSTLTVTNLDGLLASKAHNPTPIISSTPQSQGPQAGGVNFFLIGTGFAPGSTVTIGGNAATITSVTATAIIMTTPPGTAGAKPVVLTTPGGCTASATYTYL